MSLAPVSFDALRTPVSIPTELARLAVLIMAPLMAVFRDGFAAIGVAHIGALGFAVALAAFVGWIRLRPAPAHVIRAMPNGVPLFDAIGFAFGGGCYWIATGISIQGSPVALILFLLTFFLVVRRSETIVDLNKAEIIDFRFFRGLGPRRTYSFSTMTTRVHGGFISVQSGGMKTPVPFAIGFDATDEKGKSRPILGAPESFPPGSDKQAVAARAHQWKMLFHSASQGKR